MVIPLIIVHVTISTIDRSFLDGDDSANDDESGSANGDEDLELQVLEVESDSDSDTSIVGE